MVWEGWPLSRTMLLLVGLIFLAITLQVTMFHYRQNFRHWAQWVPVIGAPVFGLLAIAATFINQEWFNTSDSSSHDDRCHEPFRFTGYLLEVKIINV